MSAKGEAMSGPSPAELAAAGKGPLYYWARPLRRWFDLSWRPVCVYRDYDEAEAKELGLDDEENHWRVGCEQWHDAESLSDLGELDWEWGPRLDPPG